MWVDRGDKIGKTNDFQFLKLVFFFFLHQFSSFPQKTAFNYFYMLSVQS